MRADTIITPPTMVLHHYRLPQEPQSDRLLVAGSILERTLVNDTDQTDPAFNAMINRLLRREALRRAAAELNTTSAPGLEATLARISAEVTAEATAKRETGKDSASI
jgi:hypothetical protein